MCRGLNVKNTYLEACGGGGNVVVGGTKIGFIDLRWSETKLREGVGGRNASKNAVARFDLPASLIDSKWTSGAKKPPEKCKFVLENKQN